MNSRIVLPELLDVLSPQDASALRSRRDLRRVNAWMRHPQTMARALRENLPPGEAQQIVELGAGDGHFLLSVAKRLNGPRLCPQDQPQHMDNPETFRINQAAAAGLRHSRAPKQILKARPNLQAVLVDRLNVPDPQICGQFRNVGWQARVEIAEAVEWLRRAQPGTAQTIISNLFFHQFETEQLAEMLRLAAAASHLVVALEPRRSWQSKLCGRMLWAIGCGPVTRHDAHISIRAGFAGAELSALWPDKQNWRLTEQPVGLFSHLFIARRKE